MIPNTFWRSDEYTGAILMLLTALSLMLLYHLVLKKPKRENPPLPPGPRGLPLIGNILSLEPANLHSCLAKLSKPYGPIIKIKLVRKLCVVISSSSVAKEVFKDHDTIFSNHDPTAVALASSWGGVDMLWSPYGEHWRMLRKICVVELFSKSRLDSLYDLRRVEVDNLLNHINFNINNSIKIGDHVFLAAFNLISNMLWGATLEGQEKKIFTEKFREILEKLIPLIVATNISDLFPFLTMFDIQGLVCRTKKMSCYIDSMFDSIINRRLELEDQGEIKDFLQVLLQFKEYGDRKMPFTTTHIKALFMDLMGAGTTTTSVSIEWAMTELLLQPEIMKKAQQEVEQVVGMNQRVEESHLPKLNYINAIVKETLRLHPPGPLLIPRYPSESCVIGGYLVPKGSKILVNVWAIQRDPEYWDKPLEFQPERFLVVKDNPIELEYNGRNHNYLPFGSGKRVCVGLPMAERMTPYILASLVHSFNWKLPEGSKLDLSDTFALELRKTIPLVAIPSPRPGRII